MRILLITSSARGHAIAETLSKSAYNPEIIAISPSRNPGIRKIAKKQYVLDIMNFDLVLSVAQKYDFDFAFIGPDDPIGMGIADALESIGIPCVAPKKSLARIEASKGFTRGLMDKYHIDASPAYKVFTTDNANEIEGYLENDLSGNYVVKYNALKGGKGVKISGEHLHTIAEGVGYATECIEECGTVVIEEKLVGVEFSLIGLATGTTVVSTPVIQDHKRAYNGDSGPNTGGMGTYSDADHSLPFLSKEDLSRAIDINNAIAHALQEECGEPYKGILYGGFIAVKNGIRVIEYNARFGDPEALNILPLLETDFVDVCLGIISGSLTEDMVKFKNKATVCKYITPEGYPENKDQKNEIVSFPNMPENARIYFGDVSEDEDGSLRLGGSRTAGIVGIGDTIQEAEQVAESLCKKVSGPIRYRTDIGTNDVIDNRSTTLKQIRST